jgi:hypothetical protein
MANETRLTKIGDLAVSVASQCTLAPETIRNPISDRSRVPAEFVRETDRDIPDRVTAWHEGLTDKPVLRRALTNSEGVALMRRREDLLRALAAPSNGRHGDRCASAVSAMLAGFPTMARLDIESATATVGGYLHVVRSCPPWAVITACDQVRTGRAGLSTSYCPSEPEFCTVVRRIVATYELQLRKTEALLDAEPPKAPEPFRREVLKPKPAPDTGYARRATTDLAINKLRREMAESPSVFELDPADWDR